jgi:hypothetical protein
MQSSAREKRGGVVLQAPLGGNSDDELAGHADAP